MAFIFKLLSNEYNSRDVKTSGFIKNVFYGRYVNSSLVYIASSSVVLNRGGAPAQGGGWRNFQWGANPYMLHNMESFLTGMCTFQSLRQCEFYVATCYLA